MNFLWKKNTVHKEIKKRIKFKTNYKYTGKTEHDKNRQKTYTEYLQWQEDTLPREKVSCKKK